MRRRTGWLLALLLASPGAGALEEGVVFIRDGDIWFMKPDGSAARSLARTSIREEFPVCSPDGLSIVFQVYNASNRRYDLWLMPSSGGRARTLVRNARHPAWSPTGEWIAFGRPRENEPESVDIWIMRPDGSEQRQWTDDPAVELFPVWSPWGEALAFVRMRPTRDRQGRVSEVVSQLVTRTWEGQERVVFSREQVQVVAPSWSVRDEFAFGLRPLDSDRTQHLWRVRLDGGGLQRLSPAGPGLESTPTWSPDGTWLAFIRFNPSGGQVWHMRADGSEREPLASGDASDQTVCWFPGPENAPIQVWQGNSRRYWIPLPTVREGEVWVPVREMARAWNWDIQLGPDRQIRLLNGQSLLLVFYPNQARARAGGKLVDLSAAPYLLHGYSMVPLLSLARGMGWGVTWDPEQRVLRIPARPG